MLLDPLADKLLITAAVIALVEYNPHVVKPWIAVVVIGREFLVTGLRSIAYLNPDRQDVRDLVSAITDELITEMSFAFMLNDGEWTDDFTRFRILEADINRGDVSGVNYGANPYTSIAARSREVLDDLDHLPAGAQRAALRRLEERLTGDAVLDMDDNVQQNSAPAKSEARGGSKGMSLDIAEALLSIE